MKLLQPWPTQYPSVSLGDLCDIKSGKPAPKEGILPAGTEGGLPFIRMRDLGRHHVTNELRDFSDLIEHRFAERKGYLCLPVGAILIPRSGSVALNHRAILGIEAAIVSHICALVLRDEAECLRDYLFRVLCLMDMKKLSTKTTGLDAISFAALKKIEIPLPPLSEQKRIARILDAADALRTKRRESLTLLDNLTQSIFLDMFGDPVTNPMGWEESKVGDVVHSAKDGPHVSPKYSLNGIPFLSTRHIKPGEIIWDDLKYISQEEAWRQWKKCKPEYNDILYTKGGTTGIAARVNTSKPFAIWVHVALLKPIIDVVNPMWLESMLNSSYCYAQSQRFTHGIANRDLGLKRMVKITIFLPPLHLQQRFASIVESIEKQKERLRDQLSQMDTLFSSLQQRAFNGEL